MDSNTQTRLSDGYKISTKQDIKHENNEKKVANKKVVDRKF